MPCLDQLVQTRQSPHIVFYARRDWGWQIFRAFEMHCRLPTHGYTTLRSVVDLPVQREDAMESFFLAETLKYLLLLFSDDEVRTTMSESHGIWTYPR